MATKGPIKATCLVVGTGDDTGSAIARAFLQKGHVSCTTRRPRHADQLENLAHFIREDGYEAKTFPGDARSTERIPSSEQIARTMSGLMISKAKPGRMKSVCGHGRKDGET